MHVSTAQWSAEPLRSNYEQRDHEYCRGPEQPSRTRTTPPIGRSAFQNADRVLVEIEIEPVLADLKFMFESVRDLRMFAQMRQQDRGL